VSDVELKPLLSGDWLVACRTCHWSAIVQGDTMAAIIGGLHPRFVPTCPRPDIVDIPLDWYNPDCPCGTVECDCD
jgi:hypothetical protein